MSNEKISVEAVQAANDIIMTLCGRSGFDDAFDVDDEIRDEINLEVAGRIQMAIAVEREQAPHARGTEMITDDMVRRATGSAWLVAGEGRPWLSEAIIRSALEAVEPMLRGVPDGWVMVPIEPTMEMRDAGKERIQSRVWESYSAEAMDIYAAILAAAPKPTREGG
jgi:hypothetical protein